MQYSVRAAMLATGVSGDRLRTWERRYGVPAPARSGSGRRLYDDEDLAVIRRMAALVDAGLSAVSAAAAIRDETALAAPARFPHDLPAPDPRVVELVDRAGTFDEQALFAALDRAAAADGIEASVEHLALPALVEAGRRWERADMTVVGEHLLTEVVRAWLAGHSRSVEMASGSEPRVLVACPEDERHDLGALALALLLRRLGIRVAYLGADVPTSALVDAARTSPFDAVCLSVTSTASLPTARLALRALRSADAKMRVYVGGYALAATADETTDLLAGVRLPRSVSEAARTVAGQLREASGTPGASGAIHRRSHRSPSGLGG